VGDVSKLFDRLVLLVQQGYEEITADDITDCGRIAIDAAHTPNSKQSGIGSFFRQMNEERFLVSTGRIVKSKAPKRKGGMIQVWAVTDKLRRAVGKIPSPNGNGPQTPTGTSRLVKRIRRMPTG
jgi:hypothetical protein